MQEEIIKELMDEQKILNKSIKSTKEEILYLKEYLGKTDFEDPLKYENINLEEFLVAYAISKSNQSLIPKEELEPNQKQYTLQEAKEIASYLAPVLNKLPYWLVQDFRNGIDMLTEDNVAEDVFTLANDKETRRNSFETFISDPEIDVIVHNAVKIILEDKSENLYDFMKEFKSNKETWGYALTIIKLFKEITEEKNRLLSEGYPLNSSSCLLYVNNKPSVREKLDSEYNFRKLIVQISIIDKHYAWLTKTLKQKEKEYQKLKKTSEKIIHKIKSNPREITDYRILLGDIKNKSLRMKILTYIYEQNNKYYQELEEEYIELSENSILGFQNLCHKYLLTNIDIKALREKYSYRELEQILRSLKTIGITESILLTPIIKSTSKEVVKDMINFINQGLLTTDIAKANIQIWDKSQDYVTRIKQNAKQIESITTNTSLYKRKPQVLLIENTRLEKNLKELKNYQLLSSLETTTDYQFLSDENLTDKLDYILELGKEQDLVNNLGLLNYDKKRWDRLNILDQLNIPVSEEMLEGLLHTNNFLIPDEQIDEYLDKQQLPEDIPVLQEEIEKTPRTYIYRDVYFSKNKLLRQWDKLEKKDGSIELSQLLLKNRTYTTRELNNISNTHVK